MNSPTAREIVASMSTSSAAEHPDFLVRSRGEVMRLLNVIVDQATPLSLSLLNAGRALESTLIYVDEDSSTMLLTYPAGWEAGNPGAESIMVGCALEESKIEFKGGHCAIVDLEGTPVIGMPIPDFMWRFQRRSDTRHRVSGLNIELNMGFLQADAEVVDLSMTGIGILNCGSDLKLEDEEVLHGCTIALPGVGQIPVDLVVKYHIEAELESGRTVVRAGCQFTGLSKSSRQLISHYLDAIAD